MDLLSKLFYFIFLVFLLVISIDPTGSLFHAKEYIFILLCCYGLFVSYKRNIKVSIQFVLVFIFLMAIPCYGIIVAVLTNSLTDPEYAESQAKALSFSFIFVYLISVNFDKVLQALWINGIVLSLLSLLIYFFLTFNEEIFGIIYNYSMDHDGFVLVSKREFLGVEINGVYFKTGSLILFSYIYSLYYYNGKFNFFYSAIALVSLLLSGSRTPALVAILITAIYFYDKKVFGKSFTKVITFVAVIALFFFINLLASDTSEKSVALKYANFSAYLDNMNKGFHLLFGAGLGSTFFASGDGQYLAFTELSYMDIFRIYGVIVGTLFVLLIYYPVIICRVKRIKDIKTRRLFFCYFLFMILAGTNPILLGSTGMLVFALGLAMTNRILKNGTISKASEQCNHKTLNHNE
jgi:hypothetical protein